MSQCTATSKRTHEQCRHAAMHGRETCYHHGGVTKTLGAANRHYDDGRYSKVMPVRMAATYEAARTHPRLLSMADELAACDARLSDLFQRVDSGESGQLWRRLGGAVESLNAAMLGGDAPAMQRHFGLIRQLVMQGTSDHAAWQEIQSLWDTRCKLVLTEQKTLLSLQQMVSAEQVMLYFGVITDAIQRIVPLHTDESSARRILGDLSSEFHRISNLEESRPRPHAHP